MNDPDLDTFPRIRRGMTVWHVIHNVGDVLDVPTPSHAKVRWQESEETDLVPVGTLTVIRSRPARPYARGIVPDVRPGTPSANAIVVGSIIAAVLIVGLVILAVAMSAHSVGSLTGASRSAALSGSVSDRGPVRASSATEPLNAAPAPARAATVSVR